MATHESKINALPWALVVILIIALFIVLSKKPGMQPPPELQPFTIKFTEGLQVIATDEKGNPVKPVPASQFFPRKVRQITKLSTITVMELVGSHYLTIEVDGNIYIVPLPPPHP